MRQHVNHESKFIFIRVARGDAVGLVPAAAGARGRAGAPG